MHIKTSMSTRKKLIKHSELGVGGGGGETRERKTDEEKAQNNIQ